MRLVLLASSGLLLAIFLLTATARADAAAAVDKISEIKCEPKKGELTQAVYRCIREKLDRMSQTMAVEVFNKLRKAITAALILAIVFFAFKFILYGTRQPQAEFLTMMIKFVIIASLLLGIGNGGGMLEFRDVILGAGSGFQNLVLVGDGTFGVNGSNIFERMDNALFEIYGIKKDANGVYDVKLDKDMAGIGMMGGLLLAGPFGASAFVKGGAAIGLLVGSFMVALFINIVSLIALTFLFALSPIILPLALFPATEKMFQKWRGQIISYSLQPMIMTVFLSMMFLTLSQQVGSLANFIQTSREMGNDPGVLAIRSAVSTSTVSKGANKPGVAVDQGREAIPDASEIITGDMGAGAPVQQPIDMISRGTATEGMVVPIVPFDEAQFKDLGSQMVILLIICGAMFRFMREIPDWASELAGGDRTVPNLAKSQPVQQLKNKFEEKK